MFRKGYLLEWWLYAMLVMLHDMIKKHLGEQSNAPLHMEQDTLHQYKHSTSTSSITEQ